MFDCTDRHATAQELVVGFARREAVHVYFERLGHTVRQVREEITARMPTPEEAHGLAVPDDVPVLVVLHTGIDQDGQPFEVTRSVMRANTCGLDYATPVAD